MLWVSDAVAHLEVADLADLFLCLAEVRHREVDHHLLPGWVPHRGVLTNGR